MKLRENLSTSPFLDQPPLSAFYPLSTEIFETPPLSVNFGKLQPPLFIKGGGSELCYPIFYTILWVSSTLKTSVY